MIGLIGTVSPAHFGRNHLAYHDFLEMIGIDFENSGMSDRALSPDDAAGDGIAQVKSPAPAIFQVGLNQLSGTLAARNTWLVRIFLLTLENGFTYSQTISPDGVTSKKRPFAPSQIRVFPLGWRCAPLMKF